MRKIRCAARWNRFSVQFPRSNCCTRVRTGLSSDRGRLRGWDHPMSLASPGMRGAVKTCCALHLVLNAGVGTLPQYVPSERPCGSAWSTGIKGPNRAPNVNFRPGCGPKAPMKHCVESVRPRSCDTRLRATWPRLGELRSARRQVQRLADFSRGHARHPHRCAAIELAGAFQRPDFHWLEARVAHQPRDNGNRVLVIAGHRHA
jgi:hypothetical protein